MTDTTIDIQLPSLIRQIGGNEVKLAKQVALIYSCQIKRIRRSRNWLVTGEAPQLQQLSQALKQQQPSASAYLIHKIEQGLQKYGAQLEPVAVKLQRLVQENHNITLAELMHLTDCSIAEARSARFSGDEL
ncbi:MULTISPECIES: ribosome recycling factor family protein [unclassified Agarivorans]|uniref:ribosome recycling factor family protein n=1 Tax=unclassified Agarivorans TaxID=2636026 RepID=UPI003D7E57DF